MALINFYKDNNLKNNIQSGFAEDVKKGVSMEEDHSVCWIVDNSLGKTIKDAARFGKIEHIFTDADTDNIDLVEYAREVLTDFQDNDYLCLIGDPKLAAVCVGVIAQNRPGMDLRLLQFDSRIFRYNEVVVHF